MLYLVEGHTEYKSDVIYSASAGRFRTVIIRNVLTNRARANNLFNLDYVKNLERIVNAELQVYESGQQINIRVFFKGIPTDADFTNLDIIFKTILKT